MVEKLFSKMYNKHLSSFKSENISTTLLFVQFEIQWTVIKRIFRVLTHYTWKSERGSSQSPLNYHRKVIILRNPEKLQNSLNISFYWWFRLISALHFKFGTLILFMSY